MGALNREVLAWAAAHHQVLTVPILRQYGISDAQRRRLITEGVLVRLSDGVYQFTGAGVDELGLCVAACAHWRELVIGGPTSSRQWGYRKTPQDELIHTIAPPATTPIRAPWIKVYRTAMLDPADITYRDDGIRLTSPPRTAVDMARWLNDDDLRSLIDHVEYLGHATAATMHRVAKSLDTPGRPWARRFLAVLDDRATGGPRASTGESIVLHALRERGVTDATSQHRLDLPGFAHPIRLDAAVVRIRWGVEVDGHPDHFSELGGAYDRERDLAADAIGWRVSRIAKLTLERNPKRAIDRLMAVYERRCREFAAAA